MTPIEKHVKRERYIVVGQVIRLLDSDSDRAERLVDLPERSYKVLIKIERVYKGHLKKNEEINLSIDVPGNCNLYFKKDEQYLLFIYKKNDKYFQRHCSYSMPIGEAKEHISVIEKLTRRVS